VAKNPKKSPKSKSVPVEVYPPGVIASLVSLLTLNTPEGGIGFTSFEKQLESTFALARELETQGKPGAEMFRSAVSAVQTFRDKSDANKKLIDDTHLMIAKLLTALKDDGNWGGCKHISQSRIRQIVSLG